jgi:molybdopterin-guanine dinucleotide biosynthesis protein B
MRFMTRPPSAPVIGIAGWKKSGKTTLAVRLIEEFTRRGLKVVSVKHAHHEFDVDTADTDSARHRRAGASEVALIGAKRWAIMHELKDEPEPTLEEVLSWLSPADLVIVEGYKSAEIPKIEARRSSQLDKRPLTTRDSQILAIAADHAVTGESVPVFHLDDIRAIADFIAQKLHLLDHPNSAKSIAMTPTQRRDMDG